MEILVVISIIGIFASIVLVPLNNARNKSKNASAKTSMSDIRIFANIFNVDNGYSYNNPLGDNVCDDSPQITTLRTAAKDQTGNDTDCGSDPSAYAVWVLLRSSSDFFCVDSNGFSGEIGPTPPIAGSTTCQ